MPFPPGSFEDAVMLEEVQATHVERPHGETTYRCCLTTQLSSHWQKANTRHVEWQDLQVTPVSSLWVTPQPWVFKGETLDAVEWRQGIPAVPYPNSFFFFFYCNSFLFIYVFIIIWLCWVLVAPHGLSLVAVEWGYPSLQSSGSTAQVQ